MIERPWCPPSPDMNRINNPRKQFYAALFGCNINALCVGVLWDILSLVANIHNKKNILPKEIQICHTYSTLGRGKYKDSDTDTIVTRIQ